MYVVPYFFYKRYTDDIHAYNKEERYRMDGCGWGISSYFHSVPSWKQAHWRSILKSFSNIFGSHELWIIFPIVVKFGNCLHKPWAIFWFCWWPEIWYKKPLENLFLHETYERLKLAKQLRRSTIGRLNSVKITKS